MWNFFFNFFFKLYYSIKLIFIPEKNKTEKNKIEKNCNIDKNWYENQEADIKKSIKFAEKNKQTPKEKKKEILFFSIIFIIIVFSQFIYPFFSFFYEVYKYIFIHLFNYIIFELNETIYYYSKNLYIFFILFYFVYFLNILFSSITSYLFGVKGIFFNSFISILLFWCIQIYFINDFFFNSIEITIEFTLFNYIANNIPFVFSLKIDFISYCFLFLTTSIGVCANIYSYSYFKNEPHTDRFILMINWFILSMLLLVMAENSLILFLGWELIGLTSFLLINFWTLKRNTLKSAIKAFTFNKMSDILLLFFIIILAQNTGSFSTTDWFVYYLINNKYNLNYLVIPGYFLIFASSIKSAQIFFHLWLPDSMEAPIPASALIHSATLVSAGVYLLLRFEWLIKISNLNIIILIFGCFTALYGGVISAAQTDLKKLLAYSTISHCGFLFITISLNNYFLTLTYLYLHGFFKALTFFCIGNLVKISGGYQDSKKMGNLYLNLPVESILLVISAINLGALPFTIGYLYKNLFQIFLITNFTFILLLIFVFIAMLTSIIYVFRLIFYTLFDIQKNNEIIFDYFFFYKYKNDNYSNTTVLSYIFIFFLIVLITYIFMFYLLFLKNFLFFNKNINIEYLELAKLIKNNINLYYYFFYIFFCIIFFIIIKIQSRNEFSYLEKNYVNYYIILFFFFINLIFTIF